LLIKKAESASINQFVPLGKSTSSAQQLEINEGTPLALPVRGNPCLGQGVFSVKVFAVRGQTGFTLVETMVVAAIVGIAAALAVPNYLQWQAQSKLRQAVSEIATQLTLARMAAMNRNRGVDVSVLNSTGAVHISAMTSSSGMPVINDTPLQPGTSVAGSPITVSYSSLGLRTSGGTGIQTIVVCDAYSRQYAVTVLPTGKVNWSTNQVVTPCP
jgi:prepilin-type N-terminal cleavage/methylation domain-containing protein